MTSTYRPVALKVTWSEGWRYNTQYGVVGNHIADVWIIERSKRMGYDMPADAPPVYVFGVKGYWGVMTPKPEVTFTTPEDARRAAEDCVIAALAGDPCGDPNTLH